MYYSLAKHLSGKGAKSSEKFHSKVYTLSGNIKGKNWLCQGFIYTCSIV
jgi:hypothetical protein